MNKFLLFLLSLLCATLGILGIAVLVGFMLKVPLSIPIITIGSLTWVIYYELSDYGFSNHNENKEVSD